MTERFFIPESLDGPTVELGGGEAHHLLHVLRHKTGDRVVLFDGNGAEATAEIIATSRHAAELQIVNRSQSSADSCCLVILGTAVPKGDRFRWLVEKATELGVSRLVPLVTARSVVEPGSGKLEKMRSTVIAAAKQSGRRRLMQLDSLTQWDDFVRGEFPGHTAWLAHPTGEPARSMITTDRQETPVILAVGPEGGFTDGEIHTAVESGARLVNLGPRTLRIETAAVTLAALCGLTHGDASV